MGAPFRFDARQYGRGGGSGREPSLVASHGLFEEIGNPLAQRRRGEHFDVGPEFHDLHDELAIVGVGDLEQVTAVLLHAMALIRMPALRGDLTLGDAVLVTVVVADPESRAL